MAGARRTSGKRCITVRQPAEYQTVTVVKCVVKQPHPPSCPDCATVPPAAAAREPDRLVPRHGRRLPVGPPFPKTASNKWLPPLDPFWMAEPLLFTSQSRILASWLKNAVAGGSQGERKKQLLAQLLYIRRRAPAFHVAKICKQLSFFSSTWHPY